MATKEITRIRFSDIFKTNAEFRTKVVTPIIELFNGKELPIFLNEEKTYYTFNLLFHVLNNRWSKFYVVDEEEAFLRHFQNALLQTLPTLHLRTLQIKNDILDKIDADGILTSTITANQKDPETNNLRSTNVISETPETKGTKFTEETKVTEKSVNITTDKRVNIETTEDRVEALKSLRDVEMSGEILNWVNCREIASLFLDVTDIVNTETTYKFIGDQGEPGIQGPQGPKGERGETGARGEKGDPGTGTGTGTTDLGGYYNKQEIDTKLTTIAQQALSFTTNFLTTTEINRDFLNKSVLDIQDVKATIAAPKYINNSGELPTANSNELATTEYVDARIVNTGTFVKENYFQDNAEKLTANQSGVAGENASIGIAYKGTQNYGLQAEGRQQYGYQAKGLIQIGEASQGIEIGKSGGGNLTIGYSGTYNIISIGESTTGTIAIGALSKGDVIIGSSYWGTAEAPEKDGYLTSGGTTASFKKITDKANETVNSFVATYKQGAKLGRKTNSGFSFLIGETLQIDREIEIEFRDDAVTFTENVNPNFSLINNDIKKLDIGQSNKRVFIKVGIIVNTLTEGSIGQLEIALKSGNIDLGVENIVILNPNPNAFFVKTFGILNSDLVKAEGVSINIESQTGAFEIGGFEIILL